MDTKYMYKKERTCLYYVKHKNRYCKMLVGKGKLYCGQHLTYDDVQKDGLKNIRIPCPLDPKHSCYENSLENHLQVCNARKKTKIPYFTKDINLPSADLCDYKIMSLSQVSDDYLINIISRIESCYKELSLHCPKETSEHEMFNEILKTPGFGPEVIRHLKQNASLINIMNVEKLFDSSVNTAFVEFGAGKGQLSEWMTKCVSNKLQSSFILVDRGSQRYKFDCKLKYDRDIKYQRLKMDIQHLDLQKIAYVMQSERLVACGKHVCGAATDLALRCINQSINCKERHLVIALCCHHKCDWRAYVAKNLLQKYGFNSNDFAILLSITSWAVCGMRRTKDSTRLISPIKSVESKNLSGQSNKIYKVGVINPLLNRYEMISLSQGRRKEIGLMVKHILNQGRIVWLEENGYKARLVEYASENHTLENMAIVARKY